MIPLPCPLPPAASHKLPRTTRNRKAAARRVHPALGLVAALVALAWPGERALAQLPQVRERISLDDQWRFAHEEPPDVSEKLKFADVKAFVETTGTDLQGPEKASDALPAPPSGHPGEDVPLVQPSFDDHTWRTLNLPHDWGIEGPFKQEYPGDTGKLPWWGVGWYRKHFPLTSADDGKQVFLQIDGAMAYSMVWINGHFAGGWPYGYASYQVDLTPYLNRGGDNVIAIRLDNPKKSSRWYPGGGIYRNVWLVKTSAVHIASCGTYITTPEISAAFASVDLRIGIDNQFTRDVPLLARTQIFELHPDDSPGAEVARPVSINVTAPAGKRQFSEMKVAIASPKLWDVKSPNRYVAVTTLTAQNGALLDRYETPFGVRTIRFDADKGFLLNDQHLELNGVCDHHDLGALGSAINKRALERQVEILKEMGCNAIRTSHNPPAPELLDLCDKMGIVVMDESFDCWGDGKNDNDYHVLFWDWHNKDLRSQVRRDRNHPCVILWSIGNEIPEQGSEAGHKLARDLNDIVKSEDTTRPVTAACNNAEAGFNGFQKSVDVFGFNYKYGSYKGFHEKNQSEPVYGSETDSTISSRGEYFFPLRDDKADFQVSSYCLTAPGWASAPDPEMEAEDRYPFVAGQFVWTGFDYLGEPTPYNNDVTNLLNFTDPAEKAKMQAEMKQLGKLPVPSRSSYFGAIDLAGFKKDLFYFLQAKWRPDFAMAHILPHWNWPERIGLNEPTPVFVFTSGDEAELFLNGKSLGRKKKKPLEYRLRWDEVKYAPGELKVVAYKNGEEWAQDSVRTTGPARKLLLTPDRATIKADGHDLSYITVAVADDQSLTVPRTHNDVSYEISGPGEIVATDNGDPTCLIAFQSTQRPVFNGLGLVIVRGKPGQHGNVTVTAKSPGLAFATATLKCD